MTQAEYVAGLKRLLDVLERQGASRSYKLDAVRRYQTEAGR